MSARGAWALLALSLAACSTWKTEGIPDLRADGAPNKLLVLSAGRAFELRNGWFRDDQLQGEIVASWAVPNEVAASFACASDNGETPREIAKNLRWRPEALEAGKHVSLKLAELQCVRGLEVSAGQTVAAVLGLLTGLVVIVSLVGLGMVVNSSCGRPLRARGRSCSRRSRLTRCRC